MLRLLVVSLGSAFFLATAYQVVSTIIRTVVGREVLKKRSAGLKIHDGFSIWAGHVNSLMFADGLIHKIDGALREYEVQTLGWMFGHRRAVVTKDLELIKRVLNHENNRLPLNLPSKELDVDCIVTAEDEQWQRIRRAIAPALMSNKYKTPNVQREIDGSISKLIEAIDLKLDAAGAGQIELDLDDYAHRYSLDLVFSCFYKQADLIDFHAEVDPLAQLVNSGLSEISWSPVVHLSVVFPVLRSAIDWLIATFHPQGAWRRRIMDFIKQQTRLNFEARKHLEQLKRSGQQVSDENNFSLRDGTRFNRNMIDHVIDQFYEGKLTKREFLHSTWFLMSAADKTVADSIVYTLYQLGMHRDIQEKLRKSIQAEGEQSEYLTWVLNESLRLLPPVTSGCSRMANRDYECLDGIVPANTYVVTPSYTIHRLPEYWGEDANEFRPERFADTSSFHSMQFIPFGAGGRSCPGKDFALHEMRKLFCALLARYRFHCEPVEGLTYNSPMLMFLIPNKHVRARITRLHDGETPPERNR